MVQSRPLLVIVRGLPGSGKSSLAKKFPDFLNYELDHLFCDTNGKYRFDMQLFDEAQRFVLQMTDFALARGESVVVSDVFPRLIDLEPFINLSVAHNGNFKVIDCRDSFGNCHRVPVSVINRMREQFEPWMGVRAHMGDEPKVQREHAS